jgi:hypothetical protein
MAKKQSRSDKALDAARRVAQDELEDLGLPELAAKGVAGIMHLGEHALDLVADEYHRRACNPRPWWRFHEMMVDTLPRWRLFAIAGHKAAARRYHAMLVTGTYIGCKTARIA